MTAVSPLGSIPVEILGDLPPMATRLPAAGPAAAGGFGDLFAQGLAQVNEGLVATQADLQRLASGDVQNLHQVMIRLEESRISFQLMLQVRSRLIEAYQDVMRMQI